MLSYNELIHPTDLRVKRILETAEKHFTANGLYKSNIEKICADAGISKPTFYKYFDKKETLFFAVVIHLHRKFCEDFESQSAGLNSASDKLRLYVKLFEDKLFSNKLLAQIFPYIDDLKYSWSASPLSSEFYLHSVDSIESIIHEGIASGEFRTSDPRKAAHVIALTTSLFLVNEPCSQGSGKTKRSSAEFLGNMLLKGIIG